MEPGGRPCVQDGMNLRSKICLMFLAAAALGAAEAPKPTLESALEQARLAARRSSETNSSIFRTTQMTFGYQAKEIARTYGEAGIDALCKLYDEPEVVPIRYELLAAFSGIRANTESVRKLLLRVNQDAPHAAPMYVYLFFSQHYSEYLAQDQAEILKQCRALLKNLGAEKDGYWLGMYAVEVLGQGGLASDMPLIRSLGGRNGTRRALARLGDENATQDILTSLTSKNGEEVGAAIRDLEFIGDSRNIPSLFTLVADKRVGDKSQYTTNASQRTTGSALDWLAARAIFNLSKKKPDWPLTAPGGQMKAAGEHPENSSKFGGAFTVHFDTLSEAQRDEVVAWSQAYIPAP
jgi:hypothetical protein